MKSNKNKKKGLKVKKMYHGGYHGDPIPGDPKKPEAVADPNSWEVLSTLLDADPLYVMNEEQWNVYNENAAPFQPASGRIEGTPLVDLAIGLGMYSLGSAATGLASLGEWGYSTLAGPVSTIFRSPLTVSGTPVLGGAITGESLLNSYFAAHGATNLPEDIVNFANDPSWEGAGAVGFDIFEMLPVALDYFIPTAAPAITNYASKPSAPESVISLSGGTGKSTESIVRYVEGQKALTSHVSKQIQAIKADGAAGIRTEEEVGKAIAEVLAYTNELLKQPKFIQKLKEAQESAVIASEEMIPGIKTASAQDEIMRTANWKGEGVTTFGYLNVAPDGAATIEMFANPTESARAMVKALSEGDEVLKNAVGRTKILVDGKPAKGVYKGNTHEYASEVGMAFDDVSIEYLNTLSEEELIRVLAHEGDHSLWVPFMKHTLNEYNIGKYTYIDDVEVAKNIDSFGDIVFGRVQDGTFKKGSLMDTFTTNYSQRHAVNAESANLLKANLESELVYLLEPAEVTARLTELKVGWWKSQQAPGGQPMSEWIYNWTPEKANKALTMFEQAGGDNKFTLILKGANEKERLESLTGLLNNVLTPGVPIALGGAISATSTDAHIEEAPTSNRHGGFISNKKKSKGYKTLR